MLKPIALAAALLAASVAPGLAQTEWSEIRGSLYGQREVRAGDGIVRLEAPRRARDDRRVPVEIAARAPAGSEIRSITVIIDENPMPVSAVFDLAEPQGAARFGLDLRFNGPSTLRVVAETTDGELFMAERLVKTSGLGACAAPPTGDPDAAIAAIGEMRAIEVPAPEGISIPRRARLEMRHPQHTGMQMDQVTLLYILARYVHTVDVAVDGQPLFRVTGSISLSEDPAIEFEPGEGASTLDIRMEDTDGAVVERRLTLGSES